MDNDNDLVSSDVGSVPSVVNTTTTQEPPLFRPERIKKATNWEFIALVAPSREKRTWQSHEAKCAYCTQCKMMIPWTTINPKNVALLCKSKY
jgi:hypothetical protein